MEELEKEWVKEEWCKGIPLSVESLKSLFKYNEELFEKNLELDKKKMQLSDPIKALGTYEIPVKLHPKVTAKLSVQVVEA